MVVEWTAEALSGGWISRIEIVQVSILLLIHAQSHVGSIADFECPWSSFTLGDSLLQVSLEVVSQILVPLLFRSITKGVMLDFLVHAEERNQDVCVVFELLSAFL